MRKSLIWAASAMMAIGLLTGCGSSKSAETTAEASVAESSSEESTSAEAESSSEEAESSEAEVSADNPFNGKTVKVGCSATFVPFESIEMAADGSKTYVGMNIDIVKDVVEKNGGTVEFVDMPFKSLMAAIQAGQIDFCSGGMAPTEEREKTLDSIREMQSYIAQRMIIRTWIPFRARPLLMHLEPTTSR